jgi:hypothetical protein
VTDRQASHGRIFGLSLITSPRRPTQERTAAEGDLTTDDSLVVDDDSLAADEVTPSPARPPRIRRRVLAWVATVLAFLFVLFALVAPNDLGRFAAGAFLRLPIEGLLIVGLVLVLPDRARRVMAILVGVGLGLLTIVKVIDMGFYATLDRPFDLVLDWNFFGNGMDYLTESISRAAAIGAAIGVVVLAVGVLGLMTLSLLRLTRIVVRHRTTAAGATAVLGVAWVTCAVLGTQFVPGQPFAARSAATLAYEDARQVRASLHDQKAFAKEAAVDQFAGTPGDQLLTGLRRKDVMLAFVESYGRSAVEDPAIAPGVDAVLDAGTQQLKAAGFASESAWLTSSTSGGGSWLAHSTLLSGLWINNEQRHANLVVSDRLTLTGAFRKAGWRTVAVVPGTNRAWPEGAFYGYNKIYAAYDLGYRGPSYSWATMPDQYALSAYQRSELANPNHAPVMSEVVLVSSHAPWAPIPSMVDWKDVGDGSIFDPQPAAGKRVADVWPDPGKVRTEYGRSVQYSLNSLISYVKTYGNKNTVLIFLGDHQPAPIVTGTDASRDVPIAIVAHDPAVLKQITGWGWQDGLKPGAQAPVWPMSAFRDRFLTAFGSQSYPKTAATP